MDAKEFRAKLMKFMPGYDWTIHRATKDAAKIVATGIQSSGCNRLSTLEVTYSSAPGDWFRVRSAGYGKRAPWLGENGDVTLGRALRGLQDHYRRRAGIYHGHERALQIGRSAAGDLRSGLNMGEAA